MQVNTREWLNRYTRTIQQVAAQPEKVNKPLRSARQTVASGKKYTPVRPICTTQWDQREPYNDLCPVDSGGRSATGCAATAAAQVLKAHNYPERGKGEFGYVWTDLEGNTDSLFAHFYATTYDWANMLDNYRGVTATDEQRLAVATLMYHCGIMSQMGYSSKGSGAAAYYTISGMMDYFDYDKAIRHLILDYIGEEAFLDALAADLAQGNPAYFAGLTIAKEGHAFVGDGIDEDGLVHINWGWGGTADGYYQLTLLEPQNQGTGGSAGDYAFTENVEAYIHIKWSFINNFFVINNVIAIFDNVIIIYWRNLCKSR